jgi:hypothetical protein
MSRSLETFEEADFARCLGTPFELELPSGERVELTLVEVTPHPHLPPAPGRRRGFSAVFHSAVAGHLPQAIYGLQHAQLGRLELFLVPIGPRQGRMRYEAVFN